MIKKLIIAFCGVSLITLFGFLLSIISPWLILISIIFIPLTVSYLIPSFYKCPYCGKWQESDIPILDKFSETSMTAGRITKSGRIDQRYNTSYQETEFIKRGFNCEECGENWKVTRVNVPEIKYYLIFSIGIIFFIFQLLSAGNLNLVPIPYFEFIILGYSITCIFCAILFLKFDFFNREGKEKWNFEEYIAISKDWQWLYGLYLYSWPMYDKFQYLYTDSSELLDENKDIMDQYGFKSIEEIAKVYNLVDQINALEPAFIRENDWLIQNFKFSDISIRWFFLEDDAETRGKIDKDRSMGKKISKKDYEEFLYLSSSAGDLLDKPEMQELIRMLEGLENPNESNQKKKKVK